MTVYSRMFRLYFYAVLACIIFSAMAAVTAVWSCVGAVKASDRVVREMLGL